MIHDNGPFSGRPEDSLREITTGASACTVCGSTEGYDNLDYSGIILPFENKPELN